MTGLCVRPKRTGLWDEFDSLFDNFFAGPTFSPIVHSQNRALNPRVDIRDSKDSIDLTFALPGLKKENINVSISNNILTVSSEQKVESELKQDGYVSREIQRGSFSRSFTLPDTINVEKISADYKDGLLEVRLEKLEEVKPKQVEVKIK